MLGKYNAKDWTVVVDGSVSVTGLGEDMVSGAKDEELYSISTGGQGDVVISEINDPIGTVTITVQATCPQRKYLVDWAKKGDTRSIWCENKGLDTRFGGSLARPKNLPEVAAGAEAEDWEMEIGVFDYTMD